MYDMQLYETNHLRRSKVQDKSKEGLAGCIALVEG
jgi:hypothetical protein